jgi:hypothetical protein
MTTTVIIIVLVWLAVSVGLAIIAGKFIKWGRF